MNQCPVCKSDRTIEGCINNESISYYEGPSHFFPKGMKRWSWFPAVKTSIPIRVCLDCGLLWSQISTGEMSNLLSKRAKDEVKQRYGIV